MSESSEYLPPKPELVQAFSVEELAKMDNPEGRRTVVAGDLETLHQEIEKILTKLPGGQAQTIARQKASELLHWIAQARAGHS